MDTFNRAFAKPLRPDPEQLRQTLFALIQAETWAEAKRMVEQHPELLSDEAEEVLQHLLAAQGRRAGRTQPDQVSGTPAWLPDCGGGGNLCPPDAACPVHHLQ